MDDSAPAPDEYFRRDREEGVSPPDLSKDCTYAEHIVRARGKRTRYTSVSLDAGRIRDFGPVLYKVHGDRLLADGHRLVEHEDLIATLRKVVREQDRAERARAVQAIRYARMRSEGLISWTFDIAGVARKDLIQWAERRIRPYFSKV
jgi:hypothetical protein